MRRAGTTVPLRLRHMKLRGLIIACAAGVGLMGAVGSTAQPVNVRPIRLSVTTGEPVVVELFTAQGCSGCPVANQVVEGLSEEPGVIALTYAVDYWDYLGWPDTFARPEFAQRQRGYQSAMRLRSVYTPQVVIDGRRQLSGAQGEAIQVAVNEEAARRLYPPQVQFRETGDAVGIGSGRVPTGGAEVWAVAYRPGPQIVAVAGGDNRGQSVRHINVVQSLTRLGEWSGRPILLTLPQVADPDDRIVVMVQSRADRRILTAATR